MSDESVAMSFAEVSRLEPTAAGRFAADVNAEWTLNGKPNGGYLLAMLGRAAVAVTEHAHVVAASAHYVRSPEPGRVDVVTEVLRAGRSASQVHVRMSQGDAVRVEGLLTVGDLEGATRAHWTGEWPAPGDVAFEDCQRLTGQGASGMRVALMEQVDIRLEPACCGFLSGAPSGRGELRGWVALPSGEAFDPLSLLFAVDAFPPATFDIELAGWVPTIELTAYVRALPAPGPVRILQRAQLVEAQRVDESCLVWDVEGRLVAQATQLAAVRLG